MIEEGSVIAGRYRLISLIGEGGMASVWRAEDQTLKRMVAVKLLYVRGGRDAQGVVDQFLREARIAASVQHRNVIHTMDFGTADEQLPYMVMELLNGESLYDRMRRSPPLAMEEVVHVVCVALRGLAAVHEAGIVHRDVKPQNIFLHRDLDTVYPKLLDFGISRTVGGDETRQSALATVEGMIIGTPDYMAPEQARGEANIDKRADIYSMACIVYEGVTGRLPFIADTVGQLIVEIVTGRAQPMITVRPDVPKVLSDVIAQAMAHDREQRFVDASAFRRALLAAAERAFSGGGGRSRANSDLPPAGQPVRRESAVALAPAPVPAAPVVRPAPAPMPMPAPVAAAPMPAPVVSRTASRAAAPPAESLEWGDFDGIEPRSAKAAVPAPVAQPPAPLALPPAGPAPSMPGSRAAPAKAAARDVGLPGDNLLDALGGALTGNDSLDLDLGNGLRAASLGSSVALDLDFGGAAASGGGGTSHPALSGKGGARRASPGASAGAVRPSQAARVKGAPMPAAASPQRRDVRARQRGFDVVWLIPIVLVAALLVLLFAPALVVTPSGDEAVPIAVEARNPATADSTRQLQGLRRHDVGARPPAVRDALF